jgi:hypothetical protein
VDWLSFADGMRAFVAHSSKIQIDDVVWTGEPEGMLGRPCARLNLLGSNGLGISDIALGNDEVRYVSQGPGQDAAVRIVGNRAVTLNIIVQTRDGTPWGRAFRYLERIRDGLFLPSTQALFSDLRIGLDGPGVLIDLQRLFDARKESAASLDLRLLYAFDTMCECGEGMTPETIGTIEHVRVAGTVYTPFGGDVDVVHVPERQIDK